MTPEVEAEIKAFVKERDDVLASGDVDRIIAFHEKHNPGIRAFPNREVAEISMHKARTGAKSLPFVLRIESKKWLLDRGYTSMDEGDVPYSPQETAND